MNTQPAILLNIAETIPVLDGLVLYALADGNTNSRKVENFEHCMKFQVLATNTSNGERTRHKFALYGRLVSRKGVGVDHAFVLGKITDVLKEHLAKHGLIISGDDTTPCVLMTRAIWRYIFAAGTRVSNFANGIGIFSQSIDTNFHIGEDPIEKLEAAAGTFTLAVVNENLVKFYLGEEFPLWNGEAKDADDKMWTPCKKKVTACNVNECLEHFVTHISTDSKIIRVFPNDQMEELVEFVKEQTAASGEHRGESKVVDVIPSPDDASKPGFLQRIMPGFFGSAR